MIMKFHNFDIFLNFCEFVIVLSAHACCVESVNTVINQITIIHCMLILHESYILDGNKDDCIINLPLKYMIMPAYPIHHWAIMEENIVFRKCDNLWLISNRKSEMVKAYKTYEKHVPIIDLIRYSLTMGLILL